jgi:hypothetical protein
MIARIKMRVLLGFLALLVAGVAYSQMPAEKSEAVVTGGGFFNFTYSTATQRATWIFRWTHNDTFGPQTYTFTAVAPAGTTITAASASLNCGALPAPVPVVVCSTGAGVVPPSPLEVTFSSPFPQVCAGGYIATIGAVTMNNTNIANPTGTPFTQPASTTSDVGGVQVPNVVPVNTALCPTPIPNTPVPPTVTPTQVPPAVVPVVPQVFQHVPQGIFNGSRNNTPTPVRPVGTAGSTGIGTAGPAMPVVRPPSTGDAGLLTLRSLSLSAW